MYVTDDDGSHCAITTKITTWAQRTWTDGDASMRRDRYYLEACWQGHAASCMHIAGGWASPTNVTNALIEKLYSRACDLGDGIGCLHAAQWLVYGGEDGTLRPKSTPASVDESRRAAKAYRRGCTLGVSESCEELRLLQSIGAKALAAQWAEQERLEEARGGMRGHNW